MKSSFPLGSLDSLSRLISPPPNSILDRARLVHYLQSDCAVAVTLTGCQMEEELGFIVDGGVKKSPDKGAEMKSA